MSIFSVLTDGYVLKSKPDTIRAHARQDQTKLQTLEQQVQMNSSEKKAVFSLAGIFALRMFGLFLLLPVLSLHASDFSGSTAFLVGMALGVYGLTQAAFQIPVGLLSDKFGRKTLITIGLIVFIVGSVIAALADSIEWLIIGRAVQGGGAVSSAVLALTADLTREEQRTKAMAVIGMSIGVAFLLSMTLAPILAEKIGVDGLFWVTALLALCAIVVLHRLVPNPQRTVLHRDVVPVISQLGRVVRNPQLLQLDFGIFILHFVLTALFVVLPQEINRLGGYEIGDHWKIYLPLILLSVAGMLPLVIIGSRQGKVTAVFRLTTALLGAALIGLAIAVGADSPGISYLLISLWLFFVGFNALEAMLPSLVSRVAPAASKGTAIGVYNSLQFLGVFAGGAIAGLLYGQLGSGSVFWLCSGLVALWALMTVVFPEFKLSSSRVIDIGEHSQSQREALIDRIGRVRGVHEVTIVSGETLAYLKVDDKELDTAALHQLKQT